MDRFWESKSLMEMSDTEWEQLCDGCGRCCLHKLEDAEDGTIFFTDVACRLLDSQSCRCKDYVHRQQQVKDCIKLHPSQPEQLRIMPDTCAYRLLAEGRSLPAWHPLCSGRADSVHTAGISMRGKTVAEQDVDIDDLEEHIIHWI